MLHESLEFQSDAPRTPWLKRQPQSLEEAACWLAEAVAEDKKATRELETLQRDLQSAERTKRRTAEVVALTRAALVALTPRGREFI